MISKLSPFLDAKIYKDPRLKPALQQLRDWMGPQRHERPEGYLNIDKYFYAYVAYYLPLHFPELYWILEEIKKESFPKFCTCIRCGLRAGHAFFVFDGLAAGARTCGAREIIFVGSLS